MKMILKDTEIRRDGIAVTFESQGREETVVLSVDDFYAFHLHSGCEVDEQKLKEIKAAAEKSSVFARCLHKLAAHDRSTAEMEKWLRESVGVSASLRREILARLEKLGYLDDERYCREQIAALKNSLKGERVIVETLMRKGLEEDRIRRILASFNDEEDNALRYGEKVLRNQARGSVRKARQEVVSRLMARGYDAETARNTAEKLNYESLDEDQEDNLRSAMRRAYRRYGRRYSGHELRMRLYRYGLQQGYESAAVSRAIDEMEADNDEEN